MKRLSTLRNDIPASIVVVFVAVPLCLGIALASGAPLVSGLIAGILGGILVGAISDSPLGVSGPAAGLAVIVLTAIEDLGGFETFLVAVVLAGAMQVAFGLLRAGMLGYFFPSAVIKGMLAGIGVIIFLKQIPHALGYDKDPEGELAFNQPDGETTFEGLISMLDHIEPSAVFVSLVALAIVLLWEKVLTQRGGIFRVVPGPLAAVIFGVGFEYTTSAFAPEWALSRDHLVTVPVIASFGELSDVLIWPRWSAIAESAVWVTAATMAIVASLETLLCVAATDKLDPDKRVTHTNRELFAQGVGNMASGAVGGLPVTQVIVRSSANIQSGGKTKLSAVLHGVWLLLLVAVLPELLNMIPLAVLASILFTVGYKLARPALIREMWSLGTEQFLPFAVTILGIVFTDLLTGIAIGMGLAHMVILRRNYMNSHFLHIEESDTPGEPHQVHMTLSEEVTFLNKGAIVKALDEVPEGSELTIDKSGCVVLDYDIQEILDNFEDLAHVRDIAVTIIDDPERDVAHRRAA